MQINTFLCWLESSEKCGLGARTVLFLHKISVATGLSKKIFAVSYFLRELRGIKFKPKLSSVASLWTHKYKDAFYVSWIKPADKSVYAHLTCRLVNHDRNYTFKPFQCTQLPQTLGDVTQFYSTAISRATDFSKYFFLTHETHIT